MVWFNERSKKFIAAIVMTAGALLLCSIIIFAAVVFFQIPGKAGLTTPENGEIASATPQNISTLVPTLTGTVTPVQTPIATKNVIETETTEIIAPLLSYTKQLNTGDAHRYRFQGAAGIAFVITLATSSDFHFQMEIIDSSNEVIAKQEYERGTHEIRFTPEKNGEYIIQLIALEGAGSYTISMAFDNE